MTQLSACTIQEANDMTLNSYPPNDTGNAARFLDACGNVVRYCTTEKTWYLYDGTCWKPDTENRISRMAYEALDASFSDEIARYEAMNFNDSMRSILTSLRRQRTAAGNLKTLKNCLGMAALQVPFSPGQFDCDDGLTHIENGHVDVREYITYMYQQPDRFFTRTAGVTLAASMDMDGKDYSLWEHCPHWLAFLKQCCTGPDGIVDRDLFTYLQKAAGYSILSGDISEQKVFCLLGSGRNGKSLFINTLAELAGDYACKLDADVLCLSSRGDKDSDTSKELYRIRGSRFVYSNEFSRSSILNESFIKKITDGGRISCRALYSASIEYQPTYKLWFSTNHLPNLKAIDEGIRRRIVVIPFRNQVAEEDINRNLPNLFRKEAEGIFIWLIQGYWLYTLEGLKAPEAVRRATGQYFQEQDMFRRFLADCYTIDENSMIESAALYKHYVHWCRENGEHAVSSNIFGRELTRLGVPRKHTRDGAAYTLLPKTKACLPEKLTDSKIL